MALFFRKQKKPPKRRQSRSSEKVQSDDTASRTTFRRGRTLTGSKSSTVDSSGVTTQLKSSRAQTHELAKKRRHLGGLLFAAIAVSLGLYGLISQFTARVAVSPADTTVHLESRADVYAGIIQDYLAHHPAERLRFLLNIDGLNEFIAAKAPEVAFVESDGPAGFGASRYIVTMRQPIAGWNISGQQQYVDVAGVAFDTNYFPSPEVRIVDESGVPIEAGRAVTSNRFLEFAGLAVGLSKDRGYKVDKVVLPRGTTRSIELRLNGVSYTVKLSIDRPVGEQVEDMARAVKWLHDAGKSPKYIDVRVSGKAFYKE